MANEDIASIIKEQIKKFGDELKVEQTEKGRLVLY